MLDYRGSMTPLRSRLTALALVVALPGLATVAAGGTAAGVAPTVVPAAAGSAADEVKYAFGGTRSEVVFSWRGAETTLYYGTETGYDRQATATPSAITPVDVPGPFMEVRLTDLQPGTSYHYRIGVDGQDAVFTTAPADDQDFSAVVLGDTIASTCRTHQPQTYSLVADQDPDFVLHHGDLAIANECGNAAVHRFFLDLEASFSTTAAFMPVWGNHEYGKPTADAPAGTTRDTLANYKGRIALPNPQTVPGDTAGKTGNPGCGVEVGSPTNTCRGEDWGWFRAGRVVFISVPEPWSGAIADWQTRAGAVMAQAAADPTVDHIVTYGHRPLLSSTSYTAPAGYSAAFGALAAAYGPTTTRPDGKYVLNLAGHRHTIEVFGNRAGTLHVVNGGGGQGLIKFGSPVSGSSFRMKHLGFSTLDYDADTRDLTFQVVCGPYVSYQSYSCTPGQVTFTRTFTRP